MVRILPQQFFDDPAMRKILTDGPSCVIHKNLSTPTFGKEGFLSAHAITMVLQGTLRVENADGLFDEVPAGWMALLPKGLYTVSDILPKGGNFEAMMFFFDTELVRQFLDSLSFKPDSKGKSPTHPVLQANGEIQFFAQALLRLYGGDAPANRQLTKMKLFELLHLINVSFADKTSFANILASLDNKERRSLREFMEANFHKPLGIEDYAYLTGRSTSTFTRDFKVRFDGVSPKQWLIERRLEKAHGLLVRNHVHSISEVAEESGYENVPHFIKEFHKRFGITPKQFLIENRQKAPV
jgi:AraC family transcriptional regulator, exoenzyme S synthesis regulatory protein ExsA